jgi:hypothetical protein
VQDRGVLHDGGNSEITETQSALRPPSDVRWGLKAIGDEIGCDEEKAGYLARRGLLGDAVKKIGDVWVGSARRLRDVVF